MINGYDKVNARKAKEKVEWEENFRKQTLHL